jgi:hypothetical protein
VSSSDNDSALDHDRANGHFAAIARLRGFIQGKTHRLGKGPAGHGYSASPPEPDTQWRRILDFTT